LLAPRQHIKTGVIELELSSTPEIMPHSVLAIDFDRAMVDTTGQFNEAVNLPHSGFLTIGEGSGYAAACLLEAVEIYRDPDGVRDVVPIWGTWTRETLEPNTTLRLLSSERFGDDGSLSDGYLNGQDINYCAEPVATEQCVMLADIKPVCGWLTDSSLYELLINRDPKVTGQGPLIL
jgi:hypothetical protein